MFLLIIPNKDIIIFLEIDQLDDSHKIGNIQISFR
jgi:hypothetical protein